MKRLLGRVILIVYILGLALSMNEGKSLAYEEFFNKENIENNYAGRLGAWNLASNLKFRDVASGYWAGEPIARIGSLEIIKGFQGSYFPLNNITNAEAIAIIVRLLGRGEEADALSKDIMEGWQDNVNVKDLWAIGHISIARDLGMFSDIDYQDALYPNYNELNTQNFKIGDGAKREDVAEWIVKMIDILDDEALIKSLDTRAVQNYSDYTSITPSKREYVEIATVNEIMVGAGGVFEPKRAVTRSEMAQVVKNLDRIYYDSVGIEKKTGHIAGIENTVRYENDKEIKERHIYIRNTTGMIDLLTTQAVKNSIGQVEERDVIVYKNGQISSADVLSEGDEVLYLVSDNDEMLYLQVQGTNERELVGSFYSLSDFENGTVTIKLESGDLYIGTLKRELYNTSPNAILLETDMTELTKLPITSNYVFKIKNNIITEIIPKGDMILFEYIKGVVKNVDKAKSTIEIYDANKNIIKKTYTIDTVVEKKEYYETEDSIGYLDEIFKEYRFDQMDSDIENVEVGDTVYLRFADDGTVKKIDVSTNYGIKYAKVKKVSYGGIEGSEIMLEHEDGTNEVMIVPSDAFIRKNDRRASLSDIVIGDWVKVLYNRGIVTEQEVIETVKQINIGGTEREIVGVYKGKVSYIDTYQQRMIIQDSYTYNKAGWRNYSAQKTIALADDAEFYDGAKRVSLDYVKEFLQNDGTAYIAVASNMGKEEIKKITVRHSRETVLNDDNVSYAKGNGEIKLSATSDSILLDAGSIIVRYGRLVDAQSVFVPDYAKIVLNGARDAAVAVVTEEIDNTKLDIYRARIKAVTEYEGFTVHSFSKLSGMKFSYMPLEKVFNIDHTTKIYSEGKLLTFSEFRGYTDDTQIDKVYTVVALDSLASILVDMPYTTKGVTGEVYETGGSTLKLKDVVSYNDVTESYEEISRVDKTLNVNIEADAIIIKNSRVVKKDEISPGDKIRVMGTEDGYDVKRANKAYNGYIIFVEK